MKLTELAQQIKVLHVARADLNEVDVFKKRQVVRAHDFRDDGKPRFLSGDLQKLDALSLESLKIIGRGAGLERAAAQHVCARGLHGLGDRNDLLLGFDRAGTCDHAEVAAADLHVAHLNDHVVRVELAVAALERLRYALDGVNDTQALDEIHVNARRIADQSQHGLIRALGNVNAQSLIFEPADELLALVRFCPMLEYDDHDNILLINCEAVAITKKCGTGLTCAASSNLFSEPSLHLCITN